MFENGITAEALEMSAGLMPPLIVRRNDFYSGNILAKKAIQIVKEKGLLAELYRMYHISGLTRIHWFEPLENDIYYAHEAYKGNLQNGEFEFSCYSFFTSQVAILECCNTVSEMQDEVEAALSFASKMGNRYGLESFVSFQQIVRALRGETLTIGSFNDEYFIEEKHLEEVQHNAIGLAYYYIYRSLSAVLFGDYETAFTLTETAIPLIPYIASFYTAALLRFLHSLSVCKTIEGVPTAHKQKKLEKILEENQEWMYQRTQDAPFNFQHLYDLVDAEMKAWEGKYDECFRIYEKAILGAKENKRPYHYALACELAGQRYQKTGIERIAGFYLKEAHSAYLAWGAIGKTEAMKEKYQRILFSGMDSVKLVERSSVTAVLTNSINITALTNSIDINAVIKATQMISGEIEKTKLLEKLMSIIIENSGSNRGHIIIRDGNRWILSAYEIANRVVKIIIDDQEILLESMDAKPILPISIISYVMRTKEPLIIGNTLASQFSSDNYFSENTITSLMCFPILFHNALKGIVYLENDLLTEAFTKERLEILNIFASQACISLENSILYSELEKKVKERTAELEVSNQALSLSEDKFSKAFCCNPDPITITTLNEGRYVEVNDAWVKTTGYEQHNAIGHTGTELGIWVVPGERNLMSKQIQEQGSIRNFEAEFATRSGEIRIFLVSAEIIEMGDTPHLLCVHQDITDRKRVETKLRESESKLRNIYENANGIIFTLSLEGKFTSVSPGWTKQLGHDITEVEGYSYTSFIHPDDAALCSSYFEKVMATGEPQQGVEYRVKHKDGSWRWNTCSGAPVIDEEDNMLYGVGIAEDITERRVAEKRSLELMKELESINQELKDFAHIVSHDLKAPLRGIRSLAEWLYSDYQDKFDEEGQEQLNMLLNRTQRMYNLLEGILKYSRLSNLKEENTLINLNEVIMEGIELLGAPDNITIIIENEMPLLKLERTRILQLFENLIGNSIKYMDKPNGLIKISCQNQGDFWRFSVQDNGCGIETRNFDKIFTVFQTLKPRDEFESTGIGLTIVKKIVGIYGGKVWIESKLGEGSTFYFTLPSCN
ncbi:MAG: PAS domain S-box protein [Syntrophomonas sp.]|nr:PAS domain S-box protein [Syntrophomonas sp.]